MKKQVLIILSKLFPLYHKRKGQETHFAESLKSGMKIHTIRANYDRWKHNLDKVIDGGFRLSIREWSGRSYNSRQNEIMSVSGGQVGYQRISMTYDPMSDELKVVIDGRRLTDIERLANNDGLSLEDFKQFLFGATKSTEKQLFQGIIIHLTEYRY